MIAGANGVDESAFVVSGAVVAGDAEATACSVESSW